MEDHYKYLQLAKKLKALADRGVDGEKFNATQKLAELMEKHGFTMEDVEGEEINCYLFDLDGERTTERLFAQIVSTVCGAGQEIYRIVEKGQIKGAVDTTVSRSIEIEAKFGFYHGIFKREVNLFYTAFINANNLFHEDCKKITVGEMTREELEKALQIQKMAKLMDKHDYKKQIKNDPPQYC